MIWGVDLGVRSLHAFGLVEDGSGFAVSVFADKMETRSRELKALSKKFYDIFDRDDVIFVEEPPLAGSRNVRTFAALHQVFSVALTQGPNVYSTEVATWKKEVVGAGNAKKEDVARWLETRHPSYSSLCGDQNLIDAACIALYGRAVLGRL